MQEEQTVSRALRAYIDTSVIGGVADEEFSEPSRLLLQQVASGRLIALVSDITYRELENAPDSVKDVLRNLPPEFVEQVEVNSLNRPLVEAMTKANRALT